MDDLSDQEGYDAGVVQDPQLGQQQRLDRREKGAWGNLRDQQRRRKAAETGQPRQAPKSVWTAELQARTSTRWPQATEGSELRAEASLESREAESGGQYPQGDADGWPGLQQGSMGPLASQSRLPVPDARQLDRSSRGWQDQGSRDQEAWRGERVQPRNLPPLPPPLQQSDLKKRNRDPLRRRAQPQSSSAVVGLRPPPPPPPPPAGGRLAIEHCKSNTGLTASLRLDAANCSVQRS